METCEKRYTKGLYKKARNFIKNRKNPNSSWTLTPRS
ncbi:MAG: hypothetical protein SVW57_02890 [Thermodesulfobacteriota bacterium]|nr:hypothetical protein [Thermodesulfobacteriota bacterium]